MTAAQSNQIAFLERVLEQSLLDLDSIPVVELRGAFLASPGTFHSNELGQRHYLLTQKTGEILGKILALRQAMDEAKHKPE